MSAVIDFPVKAEARPYLDAFERIERDGEPEWLLRLRRRGLDRFAELGFPNRRGENWRYLDLRELAARPMPPLRHAAAPAAPPGAPTVPASLGDIARLVLVDGEFAAELSSLTLPGGAWLGPVSAALAARPDLVRTALDGAADGAFAALGSALFSDGYVLDLAAGTVLDRPIEVRHVASGASGRSLHTRSVIRLAAGSRATIFESFAGAGPYWRNDVLTVSLGAGAVLERVALVEEGDAAIHLGDVFATVGTAARFANFALLLGGRTVRHELHADVAGEGASCRLDGAFVIGGREEANIVVTVDHRAPNGETRELVKGVAADRAHGAFQGRIIVHPNAQKVDAHQLSRNLIIGRRAAIDTKPELEIHADDVKCAHGASVGDLDEAALFYLRARGIGPDAARRLLVEGFIREVVERVEHPGVRDHLMGRLAARLEKLEPQP